MIGLYYVILYVESNIKRVNITLHLFLVGEWLIVVYEFTNQDQFLISGMEFKKNPIVSIIDAYPFGHVSVMLGFE